MTKIDRDIGRDYISGLSFTALSLKYGISRSGAFRIVHKQGIAGRPRGSPRLAPGDKPSRLDIELRCKQSPDGCWLWTAATYKKTGYSQFKKSGKVFLGHRVSYEVFVGPIPVGLCIDHLCRVRHCVNPAHLEPVTGKENLRRGLLGVLLTHCPQGHAYDEKNTYHGKKGRQCRSCAREAGRRKRYVDHQGQVLTEI